MVDLLGENGNTKAISLPGNNHRRKRLGQRVAKRDQETVKQKLPRSGFVQQPGPSRGAKGTVHELRS